MNEPNTLAYRIEAAVALLEALVEDRSGLVEIDEELRRRFIEAAGRFSRPDRASQRKLAKAFRRKHKNEVRDEDERVLAATQMRAQRKALVFPTPPPRLLEGQDPPPPPSLPKDEAGEERELNTPRKCYVCKAEFTRVHEHYDQLCGPCADLNWRKRHATADLRGRVAIVTGSRVKIGYQAAMMLLRAGAHVIVTTRFPRDAARRYAAEVDFEEFRDRLDIHGLDLRHTPSVEAFARHIEETHDRLDFILNNACQTVRRPAGFYAHLMEGEHHPFAELPEAERHLLRSNERRREGAHHAAPAQLTGKLSAMTVASDPEASWALFPPGQLDQDLQQVDLRGRNSWRLGLAEVPTEELLEVQLVNAIAPFVLNARLKSLMMRAPSKDKHIVNVSAMEGQFYRAFKTDKHPHTNMAKAALNMMTRTSAVDYVKDGIHMNSVDTGWVTDEDPVAIATRKVEIHRFSPPLDIVDGAARIVDPIFVGLTTGEHAWGKFFKDYVETRW